MGHPARWPCARCRQEFAREAYLDLHNLRVHGPELLEKERVLAQRTKDQEDEWFVELGRHVRAGVAVLPVALFYFVFILAAFEFGVGYWAPLLAPGVLIFGALMYWMVLTRHQAPPRPRHGQGPG
jgi:hypothetical protein